MNILSIQSHVSYGYVGNKAATFPLQTMGFEVWPVNTVQFSNHTGYGHWGGNVFSETHINAIIEGLIALDLDRDCHAILSGYIGDKAIGQVIVKTVQRFRQVSPELVYLCDPVMSTPNGKNCFVKPNIPDFFRTQCLDIATIMTPNHFEIELLYEKTIKNLKELREACSFIHNHGVHTITVTSLNLKKESVYDAEPIAFLSTQKNQWLALGLKKTGPPINGIGDLFSALYLGHFLLTQDPVKAFIKALNTSAYIVGITQKEGQRELKILSHDYKQDVPNYVTLKQV